MPTVMAIWSGSIASIPSGSVLCDGNGGTVDLRNYFIVAKDGTTEFLTLAQTGGANTKSYAGHYHGIASHQHSLGGITTGTSSPNNTCTGTVTPYAGSVSHTHTLGATTSGAGSGNTYGGTAEGPYNGLENRPVYWALAYVTVEGDTLPTGAIALLNSDSMPGGWLLCNGANGTPDLRGKFLKGKATIGESLTSGGVKTVGVPSHTHSANHAHSFSGSTAAYSSGYNRSALSTLVVQATTGHTHTVAVTSGSATMNTNAAASAAVSNLPVYKVLNWIMKS